MNNIDSSNVNINKSSRFTTFVLIVVFFVVGVFFGSALDQDASPTEYGNVTDKDQIPTYLGKDISFNLYWQVWDIIKQKYLYRDEVNDIELFYGSLAGSVAALEDPYSVFFDPEVADKFTEELNGRFEGIGAEIGIKQNRLTIIAPLPDTPAENAGIRAGDKIFAIDGLDTTGMSIDRAVNLIRGDKGTDVVLTVVHSGEYEAEDITITRGTIEINSVKWELKDNNIAYIKISHFNQDTTKRFQKAVNEISTTNANKIILDLRNNPGGFLDVGIDIAGFWIDNDVVVKEVFYDESKNRDYYSDGKAVLKDMPTVVMINGGSASASEIVAGALQDYNLATLVGETTFGKGSVQEFDTLADGSAIKITVAEWQTPNNRVINDVGIEPDIVVEFSREDYNNDIDNQLNKALEIINDL